MVWLVGLGPGGLDTWDPLTKGIVTWVYPYERDCYFGILRVHPPTPQTKPPTSQTNKPNEAPKKVSTKHWTNFWQFGEFFSNPPDPYEWYIYLLWTPLGSMGPWYIYLDFFVGFYGKFRQICNRHMDPMVYPNVNFATPCFTSVKKLRRLALQKSLPFLPPPCSQFQKLFETKRLKNAIHKSVVCRKDEYSRWNKKSMSWVVWICHPYAVAISKTVVAIQNQWIVHGAGRCELGNFHIPKTYESPGTLFEPVPSEGYKNKLQSICFSDPKIRGQRKFAWSLPKNILPENGLHPFLSREVANEWFETLNNGKKTHSLIQKYIYNDIYIYMLYTVRYLQISS